MRIELLSYLISVRLTHVTPENCVLKNLNEIAKGQMFYLDNLIMITKIYDESPGKNKK